MFRTRYPTPGTAPATLTPFPPEHGAQQPVLTLIEYDLHGVSEKTIARIEDLPPAGIDDGKIRWLNMAGLGDVEVLRALGEKYDFHPLALEDVVNLGQRPKVEPYHDHLFIVADMVYHDATDRLCGEQVSMFLRPHMLITVQEESGQDVFDPVRERIRAGRGFIRKMQADYLAYALLDAIIDHFFPILESIGLAIDELEDEVLERPAQSCVAKIHSHKRTLMQLRRYVWPERDVINALLHNESGLVQEPTKVFLRDCYDHSIQIMDLIETYRDVTAGLMELYLSAVGMRTNEIMRVLTVISSIFIPLTFVAGVYGMNFDNADGKMPFNMPELHHPLGYVICLAVMGVIAIGQVLFFRRKHWL